MSGATDHEVVVGVEVHAQLATRTKLFCGCPTTFGAPPNTQTCPTCLGLPGALPVLNRRALELAVLTALGLGCRVDPRTRFDRKNYYYPDLPKNYQISQLHRNLGVGGFLELGPRGGGKRVSIENVHLEEDAGKLLHDERGPHSVVDLNRAGIPLVEIVSGPDLRSLEEVEDYMETLRSTLLYLGVSEGKMEEGDLRFEASISLRPRGATALGARVEIKNLNSMKHVLGALRHEVGRQAAILRAGGAVPRETRLYDEATGETARMRSKEEAHDYRYFPEPDLAPVALDESWLAGLRASLPELPRARAARFAATYGLPEYDAGVLTADRALADYFEETAAAAGDAKAASNWIMNDVLALLSSGRVPLADHARRVPPSRLADLIGLVRDGAITHTAARQQVFPEMARTGEAPAAVVASKDLAVQSDRDALAAVVERVLAENPKAVDDWRKGKPLKAVQGFLTGQVMKATGGKASPAVAADLIAGALEKRRA